MRRAKPTISFRRGGSTGADSGASPRNQSPIWPTSAGTRIALSGVGVRLEYVPRLRENFLLTTIGGAVYAQSTLFRQVGTRWNMRSFFESGDEGWPTSFVSLTATRGRASSPALIPPWFLPGAEAVWQRIGDTERALRAFVREVYVGRFGEIAARRIEEALHEREREVLHGHLRRAAGSEALSIVDYLYFCQLAALLFATDVWQHARARLGGGMDGNQRLQSAIILIAPVRNEIAHVREVGGDRLLRASVACSDVLAMLQSRP